MNNLEKTIDDSIKHFAKQYVKEARMWPGLSDYITEMILKNDAEFRGVIWRIVTEKLEGRS